jgi:polysaccharide biosynthesis/export protein
MKVYANFLLVAALISCWPGVAARLAAQDAPDQQPDQQSPSQTDSRSRASPTTSGLVDQSAPSGSVGPITPQVSDAAPSAADNSVSGNPSGNPAAPDDTGAQSILNNRIGPNYVIGPEDELTISVFDVPELKSLAVEVNNDGTITLPLLGPIKAAGLTQGELRDELAAAWGKKYLEHPDVDVSVKVFHSRPVSIVGSVVKPGVYYLTGRRTLVEVLAMAGGLAKNGADAGKDVSVERAAGFSDLPQDGGIRLIAPDKVSIELKKLLYSEDTKLNIEVRPFDIISVARAGIVYLVGAFNKPGGYVLDNKDQVSVMEAVAMAQGFGGNARTSQAKIIRRPPSGQPTEIPIDLKKILSGKEPDVELAASDILYVPNSTAKGIAKGTAQSVVGIVSGMVIYRGL